MSVVSGLDAYKATTPQLIEQYDNLFVTTKTLFNELWNGTGSSEKLTGKHVEFAVVTNAPGENTILRTGTEFIQASGGDYAETGQAYSERIARAMIIPVKDLDIVKNQKQLINIVEQRPMQSMMDFAQQINKQIAMGAGDNNLGGIPTLNGDVTYNPDGVTTGGLLQFKAPSAQTGTTLGLLRQGASGGISGWANQYGHITGVNDNGDRVIREVYNKASRQGVPSSKASYRAFANEQTYHNFLDRLEGFYRINQAPTGGKGGGSFFTAPEGTDFIPLSNGIQMYLDEDIDTTAFTTAAAQNGVIYLIDTNNFHWIGRGDAPDGRVLKFKDPYVLPQTDQLIHQFIFDRGLYCTMLRRHAAITGGNFR